MKKLITNILSVFILLIITVGCGYAPLDINGNWTITEGTYIKKPSDFTATVISGDLKINNEKYTMSLVLEIKAGNGYKFTYNQSDSGNLSVNYSEKTFTLNSTSFEENYKTDKEYIKKSSGKSFVYKYSINNNSMITSFDFDYTETDGTPTKINTEYKYTK